jgi:predicted transcriptional regulator
MGYFDNCKNGRQERFMINGNAIKDGIEKFFSRLSESEQEAFIQGAAKLFTESRTLQGIARRIYKEISAEDKSIDGIFIEAMHACAEGYKALVGSLLWLSNPFEIGDGDSNIQETLVKIDNAKNATYEQGIDELEKAEKKIRCLNSFLFIMENNIKDKRNPGFTKSDIENSYRGEISRIEEAQKDCEHKLNELQERLEQRLGQRLKKTYKELEKGRRKLVQIYNSK